MGHSLCGQARAQAQAQARALLLKSKAQPCLLTCQISPGDTMGAMEPLNTGSFLGRLAQMTLAILAPATPTIPKTYCQLQLSASHL